MVKLEEGGESTKNDNGSYQKPLQSYSIHNSTARHLIINYRKKKYF